VKWVDEEAVKLSWERGREDPWPNELEARGAKVVSSRWEERRGEERRRLCDGWVVRLGRRNRNACNASKQS
jgi:hypothetical protein